jgi:phage FluMu protein Com
MQIRCYNCHKPFAMNKQAIHEALDIVMNEGLNHYNAYCPHCRRANRVSTDELRRWAPDWGTETTTEEQNEE